MTTDASPRTHPISSPPRRRRRAFGTAITAGITAGIAAALVATGCSASPDGWGEESLSGPPSTAIPRPKESASGPVRPTTTSPTATTAVPPTTATTLAPVPAGSGGGVATTFKQSSTRANIGGCDLYPTDHFLNATNVDTLPVVAQSDTWIAGLGDGSAPLNFPSGKIWDGARGGMPINVVDSRVTGFSNVVFNPWGNSKTYKGPYPLPSKPKIQGHPSAQWDRHVLVVDVAECMGYELMQYDPTVRALTGSHNAHSGIRYSLSTTDRPTFTTNAPNTPMLGQYVMYDEVQAGRIDHPIGFCSNVVGTGHVWPAQASDGPIDSPDAMPMGSWLRLRADADLSELGPQAMVVADALREHGAVLTDSCPHTFNLLGENSALWADSDLETISTLSPADFEVVDSSLMQVDSTSYRIR